MDISQQELINDFVLESREHLSQLEPDLLALEQQGETVDNATINRIFRTIHSIKGSSGFLDLDKINRLSHIMENILMKIRDGLMKTTPAIVDALLAGVDKLRLMIEDVGSSNSVDIDAEIGRLSGILEDKAPAAGKPAPAQTATPASKPTPAAPPAGPQKGSVALVLDAEKLKHAKANGQTVYTLCLDPKTDVLAQGMGVQDFVDQITSIGGLLAATPALSEWEDLPADATVNLVVATVLEADLLASALKIEERKISLYEAEKPAQTADVATVEVAATVESSTAKTATVAAGADKLDTLRVQVTLLDNLMNLAGEMVLGRNQLMQILDSHIAEIRGLNSILQNINLVTSELQEAIMQTRMQPVGSIFNKFPRLMRDMARKLNKEIELDVQGSEVELDKSIIESLADPLTHLIRNSADHGVEMPADRVKVGKPRVGRVLMRAYHEAGMVNIEIIDDGKGVDPRKVKAKAIEKKVITAAEAEKMSEREVYNLLFAPGFSTAEQVTAVSGRGVGMDVVKTNIEKLGGSVEIESTLGKSTRVNLRLPLTLAIIPSLIVKVGKEKFAIPQVSIEELVRIRAKDAHKTIEKINGADVLRLRDKLLPLVRLADVLRIQETFIDPETGEEKPNRRHNLVDRRARGNGHTYSLDPDSDELKPENQTKDPAPEMILSEQRDQRTTTRRWRRQSAVTVLVLKAGNNRYGLIVSGITDNEEIVVKPLSKYIKKNICYAGATIMGDGSVAMILDPHGIAETVGMRFEEIERASGKIENEYHRNALRERQSMLIFANGPKETFAMSLPLIMRLEKITADQIERIGDKEFIQYRGGSLRLIRLHDSLSVSRPTEDQNQLFVIVPKNVKKSVGLVATKILDVLETDVDLDTSNIASPGILGSAILNERITLVLDLFTLFEKIDAGIFGHVAKQMADDREVKVLLVEDTPFFRQLERSFLESAGFQVEVACDGEEAQHLLERAKFDIVVSDIMMPNMDGFDLVKRIRANEKIKNLPVLALTSLDDDQSRQRAMEVGFNGYEVKIDKNRMLQTIYGLVCGEAAS
ncbi:MAG: response regulator [Myxococcales bacterium]|nr:response regulator [Myxococcales bacterium]